MKKNKTKTKKYETKIKIRGYSKKTIIKQQQEKQLKECVPNTCFFN